MPRRIIDRAYEDRMSAPLTQAYYDHSGFYNFGCWSAETRTQKEACENLVDTLLAGIPERRGSILDIACGLGATTRHLLRYYDPAQVIGINISPEQLKGSRVNAPGCSFAVMDAAMLGLRTGSIDNVICVEAAFHFSTRERFLREVLRVLAPGGRVVLSDILTTLWAARLNRRTPRANWLAGPAEYERLYREIGFTDVRVVDATAECWGAFDRHLRRWHREQIAAGHLSPLVYPQLAVQQRIATAGLRNYLLVSARKP